MEFIVAICSQHSIDVLPLPCDLSLSMVLKYVISKTKPVTYKLFYCQVACVSCMLDSPFVALTCFSQDFINLISVCLQLFFYSTLLSRDTICFWSDVVSM